jgi:hypothetical protein
MKKKERTKYIIYAPSYDENSGGAIVLHFLCHLLNELGEEAYLWGFNKQIILKKTTHLNYYQKIKNIYKHYKECRKINKHKLILNKNFNTKQASCKDIKNAIVIYPEVINQNPLNTKKVVRWLLHKANFHDKNITFTENELIMGYGENFSTDKYKIDDTNLLTILYNMTDVYKQTNFEKRVGSCYMIRKGKGKKFVHDENSIPIDNLSHQEISNIFNKTKF